MIGSFPTKLNENEPDISSLASSSNSQNPSDTENSNSGAFDASTPNDPTNDSQNRSPQNAIEQEDGITNTQTKQPNTQTKQPNTQTKQRQNKDPNNEFGKGNNPKDENIRDTRKSKQNRRIENNRFRTPQDLYDYYDGY